MSIPQGYVKIEPNTLYENVEYYIDVNVDYGTLPNSNTTIYPYIDGYHDGQLDYVRIYISGSSVTIFDNDSGWDTSIINNGVVTGYPTLNINLTSSPDWLYVKAPEPQPATKNVTITLDSGVESATFVFNEPESYLISFTVDGTSYQADDGMTWGEWIESDYNTGNFYKENDFILIPSPPATFGVKSFVQYNDNNVIYTDTIIHEGVYTIKTIYPGAD